MRIITLIPIKPILDVSDVCVPFAKHEMVEWYSAIIGTVLVVFMFFVVVSTIAHLVGMRIKTVLSFCVPNTVNPHTQILAVKSANGLIRKIACCCVMVVIRGIIRFVSILLYQVFFSLICDI